MKTKFLGILFSVTLLAGIGCSSNKTEKLPGESAYDQSATETNNADASSAAQMAYICPMECEGSASHEPGKCPVCAMDLVKNPNYKGATADSTAQKTN
ncbi:heavy metal-binding domain-containing protein [Adhaeribacter aerolatus]|nr:heavy metal-binding domain-containing protein [Adhaeribacter aerolatus]